MIKKVNQSLSNQIVELFMPLLGNHGKQANAKAKRCARRDPSNST
jgi:hypothetical protein